MHLVTVSPLAEALNGTAAGCPDLTEGTVLVSGWAQLAVCIAIVTICCCCTLLCLCSGCVCCTSSDQPSPTAVVQQHAPACPAVISDKPPSYEEAQRQSISELPTYQEALRGSLPRGTPPSFPSLPLDS